MSPCSQPLQGEALAEAHAKVTHGENLWGERRHFGIQPGWGEAEGVLPLNPGMAREPHRVLTPLFGHTVTPEEEGWRSSG